MARDRQPVGTCPKCRGGNLACTHNHFQRDDLTIDSWEHRCPDCGMRETTAFRSDEPDSIPDNADVLVCPYCERRSPEGGNQ